MSWWDYGYQIAGMANRTTLVDNNTWNNSHIALVRVFINCKLDVRIDKLSYASIGHTIIKKNKILALENSNL